MQGCEGVCELGQQCLFAILVRWVAPMERHKQIVVTIIYLNPKHKCMIGLPVNNQLHNNQHNWTARSEYSRVAVKPRNKSWNVKACMLQDIHTG